ncbi:MAG: TerC family protein [Planctomycetes bacterium]|nr:TerC family protein [Planctomycetota bacterium]
MPAGLGTPALWAGFVGAVVGLLLLDLCVFQRKARAVSIREAILWSAAWIGLALAFNGWVGWHFGPQAGLEFLTGYLIEKALSVDNLFVFLVVFSYFGLPVHLQHRVLFWGILGALLMRAIFILAGAAILARFHWLDYVMGAFLCYVGGKLLVVGQPDVDPERNVLVRLCRRLFPVVGDFREHHFFVRHDGRLHATMLFLTLVAIEATDVVFAVDSIPAIFAVTRDPFIVFTSNICAILGLRALFFVLAGVMKKFRHLDKGLALVLGFVGLKMLLKDILPIPIELSLGLVALILGVSVAASLVPRRGAAGET